LDLLIQPSSALEILPSGCNGSVRVAVAAQPAARPCQIDGNESSLDNSLLLPSLKKEGKRKRKRKRKRSEKGLL
jgi:hypothetical protein